MSFQAAARRFATPFAATPQPVVTAFAVILALKLGVLALFGPASQPDTLSYVRYTDAILSGAFRHVDLIDPMPVTLTRVIGYPALIAAAKIGFGRDWAVAVVLFQFAVSLIATAMVYRLARAFGLGVWLSLGIVAAQATSMQFVVDQAVLTDSLCGSTMTIAMCILGLIVLRRTAAPLPVYLGAGALIAAAFLIRDVVAYLALGLIPLALTAAAMTERTRWRSVAAVGLLFLPLIATHVAYTEWNRARVGAPVVTSIAQAALFGALIEAAQYDETIFAGSSPLDVIGRRILPKVRKERLGYEQEISEFLHREYGWDAVRMSHEATLAYLRGWRDHPYAMIRHVLYHMSEQQLHQAVRPIETIRDVILWNTGKSSDLARERVVRAGNWRQIPAVIVNWIVMTISVFVFVAFVLVTPIRLVREGWNAETGVSIGIWCYYMTVGWLYAAVHLEPRYLTPVVAGSIVVGTVNIVRVIAFYRGVQPVPEKIVE